MEYRELNFLTMLSYSKIQKHFENDNVISRTHHAFVEIISLGCFVQQLGVLQLLTHVLESVKRLIQLHRHGHLRQVFTNVVPQDIPQVNIGGIRRWSRQTCTPPVSKHAPGHISIRHCGDEIQGEVVMRLMPDLHPSMHFQLFDQDCIGLNYRSKRISNIL